MCRSRVSEILRALEAHPLRDRIRLGLDRVRGFLDILGNPHDSLPPVVHVAGTNGKGSLIAYMRSILREAGYRVHVYTSPHLVRFNERIILCDEVIDDDYLEDILSRVLERSRDFPVTFFEATTAAAFLAFSEVEADILLLETGLGGRLDATNVVTSSVVLTAITPVSLDHQEFLGDDIGAIAREKAGILRPSVACVVGRQELEAVAAIASVASDVGAGPLYRYGIDWSYHIDSLSCDDSFSGGRRRYLRYDSMISAASSGGKVLERVEVPLEGTHQYHNAAMAIACVEALSSSAANVDFCFSDESILKGIAGAEWPARLQRLTSDGVISKRILRDISAISGGDVGDIDLSLWLDGGHNPAAGLALAEWIEERRRDCRRLYLVVAMVKGKDAGGYLRHILPLSYRSYATIIPDEPCSMSADDLCSAAAAEGFHMVCAAGGSDGGIAAVMSEISEDIAADFVSNQEIVSEKASYDIVFCGSLYFAGFILDYNS